MTFIVCTVQNRFIVDIAFRVIAGHTPTVTRCLSLPAGREIFCFCFHVRIF